MKIEVSIGEIVDKLTILQLKKDNIKNDVKLKNIILEYDYLFNIVFNELNIDNTDYNKLFLTNKKLWEIEDKIRQKEKMLSFDDDFIDLARNVYITNDIRSDQKKDINLKYKSLFVEEKSYE